MVENLIEFGSLNQFEDKKSFKEKWSEWILTDTMKENIEKERQEFILQGYEGTIDEIEKRLYNSCRFYYLKNIIKEHQNNQENKPEKKRKVYEKRTKEYLQEMDDFILMEIENESYNITDKVNRKINTISPAQSYFNYLDKYPYYKEEVKEEMDKRKKTFKNRFYLYGKNRKIEE
jgi:hypothetical protein